MSMFCTIELIMEGATFEVVEVLDKLRKINTYDVDDLLAQLDSAKKTISKIGNSNLVRVFIDFTAKSPEAVELIYKLSNEYPKILFTFRNETDSYFIEKQYQKGMLINELKFDSLVNWRLHTYAMKLNSMDVTTFIENDLEYLVDEAEDFESFERSVLNEFEDVVFNSNYSKNDLLKDIKKSYKNLME